MKKYYLCSIQSKKTPAQNETVLVLAEDLSEFVSSVLNSDCLLIFSECSTFKLNSDEK